VRNDHVQPTIRDILHTAAGITDRAMPTDDEREELIQELVSALRDVHNYFWNAECNPPILKESDVQEAVEAAIRRVNRH